MDNNSIILLCTEIFIIQYIFLKFWLTYCFYNFYLKYRVLIWKNWICVFCRLSLFFCLFVFLSVSPFVSWSFCLFCCFPICHCFAPMDGLSLYFLISLILPYHYFQSGSWSRTEQIWTSLIMRARTFKHYKNIKIKKNKKINRW